MRGTRGEFSIAAEAAIGHAAAGGGLALGADAADTVLRLLHLTGDAVGLLAGDAELLGEMGIADAAELPAPAVDDGSAGGTMGFHGKKMRHGGRGCRVRLVPWLGRASLRRGSPLEG